MTRSFFTLPLCALLVARAATAEEPRPPAHRVEARTEGVTLVVRGAQAPPLPGQRPQKTPAPPARSTRAPAPPAPPSSAAAPRAGELLRPGQRPAPDALPDRAAGAGDTHRPDAEPPAREGRDRADRVARQREDSDRINRAERLDPDQRRRLLRLLQR